MALKTMSIAKLRELKAQVDAAIGERVNARREELETALSKLAGYTGESRRGRPAGRGGPRGSVAPKYRNPENPSETWAGRGLKPTGVVTEIRAPVYKASQEARPQSEGIVKKLDPAPVVEGVPH